MPKRTWGNTFRDFAYSKAGNAILTHVGKRIADKVTGGSSSTTTNTKSSGGGSGFLTANYDASRIYKKKKPSKKKKAIRKFARKVNKVVRRPSSINYTDFAFLTKDSLANGQECAGISMLGFNVSPIIPVDDIRNNQGARMLRMGQTDNSTAVQAIPTGPDYMRSVYIENVSIDVYFTHQNIAPLVTSSMVIDFYECLCIRDVPTTWAPTTVDLFRSCFNIQSVTPVTGATPSVYQAIPETPFTARGWGRYATVQKVDRILLPLGQTAHRSFLQKFGGKAINYQKIQDKVMLKGTKFYFWTFHGVSSNQVSEVEPSFPPSRLKVSWTYNAKFHHFDNANTNNISTINP